MPKTRVFIDCDGTMTLWAGEKFMQEFVNGDAVSKWQAQSVATMLLEKLESGKMEGLMKPGVIATILKLQAAEVEVWINSSNYEAFIAGLLRKNGLSEEALRKLKIAGRESNDGLSDSDNRDLDKIERIKREAGKELGDRNFVMDDSSLIVEKCRLLQDRIALEVITAKPGKFDWENGGYYEQITTSVVRIREPVQKERKERESLRQSESPMLVATITSGRDSVQITLGSLSPDVGSHSEKELVAKEVKAKESQKQSESPILVATITSRRNSVPIALDSLSLDTGSLSKIKSSGEENLELPDRSVLYPSSGGSGLGIFPQASGGRENLVSAALETANTPAQTSATSASSVISKPK